MKILFDHQIFTLQKYGGISRYFYELAIELNKISGVDCELSLLFANNYYISNQNISNHFDVFSKHKFPGKNTLFGLVNKSKTISKLCGKKFEIFHPTYYDPYFLNFIGKKPFVLTVHDLIQEKYSHLFSVNDKTTHHKKILVEKATKIIAISKSTKKDLIDYFGIDESKVEVIYHGNSMFPKQNLEISINLPKKYLIFVGKRELYKNFDRFIRSIASILLNDKEIHLVCAGGGAFSSEEYKHIRNLNVLQQISQFDIDDVRLAYFYKNALAFIFPSLYEGFGIPILESFACFCPVICSNTSSLPEIAGDGACYFDPISEKSIHDAVVSVIYNASFRETLIKNGTAQLKRFSWKKTAEETFKIYNELV